MLYSKYIAPSLHTYTIVLIHNNNDTHGNNAKTFEFRVKPIANQCMSGNFLVVRGVYLLCLCRLRTQSVVIRLNGRIRALDSSVRAHISAHTDAIILLLRQNDIATSFGRSSDVFDCLVCPLGWFHNVNGLLMRHIFCSVTSPCFFHIMESKRWWLHGIKGRCISVSSDCVLCVANCNYRYIDGFVQERRNSIANALELRLSCTNPSICIPSLFGVI